MNTHTGAKPYVCSYCDEAFGCLQTRNKHVASHIMDKLPYQCPFCDMGFRYAGELRVHSVKHNNKRPHVCSYLDRVSLPDLPFGDGRICIVKSGELDDVVTGRANGKR